MLLSLSACVSQDPALDELLQDLSEYAAVSAESYSLVIETTERGGATITEKYTVTFADGVRNVTGRIEKINPFLVDGDTITAPDEYMTVTESSFTVSASESDAFALPAFKFSQDTLSEITTDLTSFPYVLTADVTSPSAFMGTEVAGSNMKLTAEYVLGSLYAIQLRYKTENDNTVTVTYTYN